MVFLQNLINQLLDDWLIVNQVHLQLQLVENLNYLLQNHLALHHELQKNEHHHHLHL